MQESLSLEVFKEVALRGPVGRVPFGRGLEARPRCAGGGEVRCVCW